MKAKDVRHGDKPERLILPKPESGYFELIVESIPPTWRDLWAILRGRYEPRLHVYELLDVRGINACLKDVWTKDRLEPQLNQRSPLLDRLVPSKYSETEE